VPTYGLPDYFDSTLLPQGVFAGRGGEGERDGRNGRVTDIIAQQIAAIGAGPDAQNRFHAASQVSGIRADLIGFEIIPDGFFQPGEGFILGDRISRIETANSLRTDRFTNPQAAFIVTA
jgi:hypothetical protein